MYNEYRIFYARLKKNTLSKNKRKYLTRKKDKDGKFYLLCIPDTDVK